MKMDTSKLSGFQRTLRMNIRNLFMVATADEIRAALPNYSDEFSRSCLLELLAECE